MSMTIANTAPRAAAQTARPAREQQPPDHIPSWDIDFSTIDTEQKAALLPTLTHNILDDAAISMSLADITAPDGPHFNVKSELSGYIGNTIPVEVNYSMAHASHTMDVAGTIGKTPITETWTIDGDMAISIQGKVGSSEENLRFFYDKATNTQHLDGKVGSIEVHKSSVVTHAPNFWDGTVGSLVTHDVTRYETDSTGAIVANHTTGRMTSAQSTAYPANSMSTQIDTYLLSTPSRMAEAGRGVVADVPVSYLFDTHSTNADHG